VTGNVNGERAFESIKPGVATLTPTVAAGEHGAPAEGTLVRATACREEGHPATFERKSKAVTRHSR